MRSRLDVMLLVDLLPQDELQSFLTSARGEWAEVYASQLKHYREDRIGTSVEIDVAYGPGDDDAVLGDVSPIFLDAAKTLRAQLLGEQLDIGLQLATSRLKDSGVHTSVDHLRSRARVRLLNGAVTTLTRDDWRVRLAPAGDERWAVRTDPSSGEVSINAGFFALTDAQRPEVQEAVVDIETSIVSYLREYPAATDEELVTVTFGALNAPKVASRIVQARAEL